MSTAYVSLQAEVGSVCKDKAACSTVPPPGKIAIYVPLSSLSSSWTHAVLNASLDRFGLRCTRTGTDERFMHAGGQVCATLQDHLQDGPFLQLGRLPAQQVQWLLQHLQWGGRLQQAVYRLGELSFKCDELAHQQDSYGSPPPDTEEDDGSSQQVSCCSCISETTSEWPSACARLSSPWQH